MTELLGIPVEFDPTEVGEAEVAAKVAFYREPFARCPAAHRDLVKRIVVNAWTHAESSRDGTMRLTVRGSSGDVEHETGHHVSWQDDDKLLKMFARKFWRHGRASGTPVSKYAKSSLAEDFAESYRCYVERSLAEKSRSRFEWFERFVGLEEA